MCVCLSATPGLKHQDTIELEHRPPLRADMETVGGCRLCEFADEGRVFLWGDSAGGRTTPELVYAH